MGHLYFWWSVFRDGRINLLRPSENSARKVFYPSETGFLEEIDGLCAAYATFAVSDDFAARVEFVDTLGQIAERDQVAANIADLVLVRLTDVKDEDVFVGVQAPLEFLPLRRVRFRL